jgi:hypothetical protein
MSYIQNVNFCSFYKLEAEHLTYPIGEVLLNVFRLSKIQDGLYLLTGCVFRVQLKVPLSMKVNFAPADFHRQQNRRG